MPGPTYRIPKTGLFLESDGRVVKAPAAGATVIDVGTNRTDYGLVGDVDFAAVSEVAGAITRIFGRFLSTANWLTNR